jgi:hypothetical protein
VDNASGAAGGGVETVDESSDEPHPASIPTSTQPASDGAMMPRGIINLMDIPWIEALANGPAQELVP